MRSALTSRHLRLVLFLLVVVLLAACHGSAPRPQAAVGPVDAQARKSEPHSASPPAVEAPPPRHYRQRAPSGRGAAADRGAAQEESASADGTRPAPRWRRPGLGTEWGESRDSQIVGVNFFRQYPSSPSAELSVFYDNEAGIHAATGRDERYAHAGVFPVRGGALTVSLTDSGGDPLPALQADGRNYVIGDDGDRYRIRITNHTPGRFEVVATVDGLDVMDGQEGNFTKRGYVVEPWGTLDIDGFRDSERTVRAFRFGRVSDSYAVRRGKGQNVGVIGVALFEEEGFYWGQGDWGPRDRRYAPDPFPGRFAPAP